MSEQGAGQDTKEQSVRATIGSTESSLSGQGAGQGSKEERLAELQELELETDHQGVGGVGGTDTVPSTMICLKFWHTQQ